MHGDRLVHKEVPEPYDSNKPWVVYNMHGDHAFFYTAMGQRGVDKMKVQPPQQVSERRLVAYKDKTEGAPTTRTCYGIHQRRCQQP